jgi:hypothetical protein
MLRLHVLCCVVCNALWCGVKEEDGAKTPTADKPETLAEDPAAEAAANSEGV